jgi:DNA-binding response OmpR family regulator
MSAPTVLVAEDDPDLRDLVAITLADAGMDVDVAADGREALARVQARRPDLVLLDMMMPVMDGRQFSLALRTLDHPPPIVVMTAVDRIAQSAADVGAVSWLAKPFDLEDLVSTVRRCLP